MTKNFSSRNENDITIDSKDIKMIIQEHKKTVSKFDNLDKKET